MADGPTNPTLLAASAADFPKTFVGQLQRIGTAIGHLGAIEFRKSVVPIRPTPFAITYALPHAYGGVVNNEFYGIPESQSLLTLPYVVGTPAGALEAKRGQLIHNQLIQRQYVSRLVGNVGQLSDAELLGRLRNLQNGRPLPGSTAAQQTLAAEIQRRKLTGPIPGVLTLGTRPTVEGLLAKVPQPPAAPLAMVPFAEPAHFTPVGDDQGGVSVAAGELAVALLQLLQSTNPADP